MGYVSCPLGANGGWYYEQTTQPDHPGAVKHAADVQPGKRYRWLHCQGEPKGIRKVHSTTDVVVESVHKDYVMLTDSISTFKVELAQLGLAPNATGVWNTCQHLVLLEG